MQRVCFLGRVRPDRLAEYSAFPPPALRARPHRAAHREVWPEMTAALRAPGWANYTLFSGDDGLLIGYLETDDFDAARRRMEQAGVNARWQARMAPFFADIGDQRPDEGFRRITEIFHLD
jgi:L-rhamnose mutarotase